MVTEVLRVRVALKDSLPHTRARSLQHGLHAFITLGSPYVLLDFRELTSEAKFSENLLAETRIAPVLVWVCS